MPTDADPVVTNWYVHLDKELKFQVLAVDELSGLVEIQYYDGDREELDLEDWYLMEIEPGNEPEDCPDPVDDIEQDTLGLSASGEQEQDWDSEAQELQLDESEDDELREDWNDEGPDDLLLEDEPCPWRAPSPLRPGDTEG